MAESRVRHWFWALSSWELFLAERTYLQVMLVFRVLRDPSLGALCSEVILDDLDHITCSFNSFVIEDTDYFIWFLQSSAGPIMDDYLMSRGKVLSGMARARLAFEAHLWLHVGTL